MIVLDTNIVSEPSSRAPSMRVMGWLDRQDPSSLFIPTPVIAELAGGAQEFQRRTGSPRYIVRLQTLLDEYFERILDFTTADAVAFGRVIARRNAAGRPVKPLDAMIAATCITHGATLATRNVRDFEGLDLKLVNPFEA